MTMIGTFQAGRKGFPAEVKVPETPFSSTIFYEKGGPLSLTQYRVKGTMSKGKISVVVMTTQKPIEGATKDDTGSQLFLSCTILRRLERKAWTVGSVPQRIAANPIAFAGHWTVAVFSYLLDTTRVNTQTFVSLNIGKDPRKVNSFDFGHKLAMDLIAPHLYNRELTNVKIFERI
ncbi:hypothetical protein ACHWQZ_G017867 [Mnemiopsis leidyi]